MELECEISYNNEIYYENISYFSLKSNFSTFNKYLCEGIYYVNTLILDGVGFGVSSIRFANTLDKVIFKNICFENSYFKRQLCVNELIIDNCVNLINVRDKFKCNIFNTSNIMENVIHFPKLSKCIIPISKKLVIDCTNLLSIKDIDVNCINELEINCSCETPYNGKFTLTGSKYNYGFDKILKTLPNHIKTIKIFCNETYIPDDDEYSDNNILRKYIYESNDLYTFPQIEINNIEYKFEVENSKDSYGCTYKYIYLRPK